MLAQCIQIVLLTALLVSSAAGQSTLTGHVFAVEGSVRSPAKGAWVVASSGSPALIITSSQADASGAYILQGLPEGRVEFSVSHRGHFTMEAGGAPASLLARTCPPNGSCGEADFVIARASVLEGYVSDPFGDPLAEVIIDIQKIENGLRPAAATRFDRFTRPSYYTDDRGYFRIFGLAPGDYEITPQAGRLNREIYTSEPVRVSVELGRSSSPLYLSMAATADPVHIGGVIEGLILQGGEFVRVIAANANGSGQGRPMAPIRVEAQDDGTPTLSGELPPGDYILTAEIVSLGNGPRTSPSRVVALGRQRIDSNTTDLRFTARPGASFIGHIRFDHIEPRRVNLTLTPLDGGTPDAVRFGGNGRFQGGGRGGRRDNSSFQRSALLPGRYRLEANCNDCFIDSETEFFLSEGAAVEAEIVVSGAFAEVRGTVRPPQSDTPAAGPFLIALRNSAGRVFSTQTDATGRYSFAKVLPGDYEICAWVDVSVRTAEAQTWTAAGAAVKRFPVSAGDRTEIQLTATP